jgi:LuxR family maltose regulon positive regulatory protein
MLAMESCVHYKMKDKRKAMEALAEAYRTASPNDLYMPFIELGKDMRTLTGVVLKETDSIIPKAWLEKINRKSATYAKYQSGIIVEYKKANPLEDTIVFSQRQEEILSDLSHGLSRADIASSRKLSENTVKMIITNIYDKLDAENRADLIRIAVKRKVI